jgi:hypothetical protein
MISLNGLEKAKQCYLLLHKDFKISLQFKDTLPFNKPPCSKLQGIIKLNIDIY